MVHTDNIEDEKILKSCSSSTAFSHSHFCIYHNKIATDAQLVDRYLVVNLPILSNFSRLSFPED